MAKLLYSSFTNFSLYRMTPGFICRWERRHLACLLPSPLTLWQARCLRYQLFRRSVNLLLENQLQPNLHIARQVVLTRRLREPRVGWISVRIGELGVIEC